MTVTCHENVRLEGYTTFQLGGACTQLLDCATADDVEEVVRDLYRRKVPFVFMGGGSNLLVSDHVVDATVVRYASTRPYIVDQGETVRVSGGTELDALVGHTVEAGLDGLVCCSGIPGTVGGAVVGNAGAWGKQIGDVLESVTLLDDQGRMTESTAGELDFGYRRSGLQQGGRVVLSVRFRLLRASRQRLLREREDILEKRAQRHPDLKQDPCIGSFFRNIEPTSAAGRRQAAGWFLERAGAKTMSVGGARVFGRHANIIVKGDNCTAQDVRDLAVQMQQAVFEAFGLELKREVRYLGTFRGEDARPAAAFY